MNKVAQISSQINALIQPTETELVDELQSVREQIAYLQAHEKSLANAIKSRGVGLYAGTIADCSVIEVVSKRVNVEKLIKKLNISKHIFERYYMITTSTLRSTIVNKRITYKKN